MYYFTPEIIRHLSIKDRVLKAPPLSLKKGCGYIKGGASPRLHPHSVKVGLVYFETFLGCAESAATAVAMALRCYCENGCTNYLENPVFSPLSLPLDTVLLQCYDTRLNKQFDWIANFLAQHNPKIFTRPTSQGVECGLDTRLIPSWHTSGP